MFTNKDFLFFYLLLSVVQAYLKYALRPRKP